MKIQSIDHIVLTVQDIDRTCKFYEVLGAEKKFFGDDRVALHFGSQKINLHQVDNPVDPNVRHASCGSADMCFTVDEKIEKVMSYLQLKGIQIIEGPCRRTGAAGPIDSVYLYDPDENLVELCSYL